MFSEDMEIQKIKFFFYFLNSKIEFLEEDVFIYFSCQTVGADAELFHGIETLLISRECVEFYINTQTVYRGKKRRMRYV